MLHKYFLTFPQEILDEPVLYTLGQDFNVVPNIRGASISDEQALMAVELAGEDSAVTRAIAWLKERGVGVEPLGPDRKLEL